MKNGIVYIAFEKTYDQLCSEVVKLARKVTAIDIHVITNTPDNRRTRNWDGIENITFNYVNMPLEDNRKVKIDLINYTPFEQTLFIDCDTVIQNPGVEKVFDQLEDHDMACNRLLHWGVGQKIIRLYAKMMKIAEVDLPLPVYNGGCWAFKSNDKCRELFKAWQKYWAMGNGRDMPAFCCSLKKLNVNVAEMVDGFFAPENRNEKAIIQHNFHGSPDLFGTYGLTVPKRWTPFDNNSSDWNWVNLEEVDL